MIGLENFGIMDPYNIHILHNPAKTFEMFYTFEDVYH